MRQAIASARSRKLRVERGRERSRRPSCMGWLTARVTQGQQG